MNGIPCIYIYIYIYNIIVLEHKLKIVLRDFLVKVITRYIKIHYENSQNALTHI